MTLMKCYISYYIIIKLPLLGKNVFLFIQMTVKILNEGYFNAVESLHKDVTLDDAVFILVIVY